MTSDLAPPHFDAEFRARLRELIFWRRDVRRFKSDTVDEKLVLTLLELASHAPSVGFSQPWRFVLVDGPERRQAVRQSFERANADALACYAGERRGLYARLKLEGLQVAPVQLAVFADEATAVGSGLGSRTMPQTLAYSVVGAVHTFWLAARAYGLGVGWVSIIEPDVVTEALDVAADWRLVAYLCIGWPAEEHLDPELERHGWEQRIDMEPLIFRR